MTRTSETGAEGLLGGGAGTSFKLRAIVTCVTLVMLLLGSAIVFGRLVQQREVHGRLINISGRQRMLSQRIALMSSWLANEPTNWRVRAQLGDSIDVMSRAHVILTRGVDNPTPLTSELHAHYFWGRDALDPMVERFLSLARKVHRGEEGSELATHMLVSSAEEELLARLDGAVKLYERDNVEALKELTRAFYVLLFVSMIVVTIVGVYVIYPLIREVSVRMRELEEVASQLVDNNVVLEERVATRTAELEDALGQRTQLLRELHHRVKNNLQIVSSLIRLQMARATDERVYQGLEVTQSRIDALARLHRALHDGGDIAGLDLGEYLRELVPAIVAGLGPDEVTLELEAVGVPVSPDTATPCGLLVNELVTNAIKYGRSDDGRLRLRVSLEEHGEELVLEIADEGKGLTDEVMGGASTSLGLQLVRNLGAQLEGTFAFDSSHGACVSLTFPRPHVSPLIEI